MIKKEGRKEAKKSENNEIKKDNQSSYRAMAILKVCLKYNKYAMEQP